MIILFLFGWFCFCLFFFSWLVFLSETSAWIKKFMSHRSGTGCWYTENVYHWKGSMFRKDWVLTLWDPEHVSVPPAQSAKSLHPRSGDEYFRSSWACPWVIQCHCLGHLVSSILDVVSCGEPAEWSLHFTAFHSKKGGHAERYFT